MPFPLDVQFVIRAEVKLSRKLPVSYKVRMCRANGGEVRVGDDVWSLNPIFDDGDQKRLKRTCNDIVRETTSARQMTHFPRDAVAIGHNGGGDILVFVADPSSDRFADAVCWWDHETAEVIRIADDFLELEEDPNGE